MSINPIITDEGYGTHFTNIKEQFTLRDLFAGLALSGMLSDPNIMIEGKESVLAKTSYNLADAMLKEREEKL